MTDATFILLVLSALAGLVLVGALVSEVSAWRLRRAVRQRLERIA